MAVIFKPENHQYESLDGDGLNWMSVTSFISQFKQPFDADAVALKSSKNKKSKWYGMTPEQIKDAWAKESKRATDLGTFYHNQRESDICGLETLRVEGEDLPIFKPIEKDGIRIAPEQKLKDGIYPEHMVYLKSAGLCGQSDRVEVVKGVLSIKDYKTNKEIKTEAYRSWDGKVQKMLPPISHLDDCSFVHYSLQLSMYMFMILKHNPTLKPGKLTLQHILFEELGKDKFGYPITALDGDGNPIVKDIIEYNVPYLKSEVVTLMNWWKENRDKYQPKYKAA